MSQSDLRAGRTSTFTDAGKAIATKPSHVPTADPPGRKPTPKKPAAATHEWVRTDEADGQPRIVARHAGQTDLIEAVRPVFDSRLKENGPGDAATRARRNARALNTLLCLAQRLGLAPRVVAAMAKDDDLWAVLQRATPGSLLPPEPSLDPLVTTPLLAPANKAFASEVIAALILHGAPEAAVEYLKAFTPGTQRMLVRQLREHPDLPLNALKDEHAAPFRYWLDELDKELDDILASLRERHCFINQNTAGTHVAVLDYRDAGQPENFPVDDLARLVAELAATNGNVPLLLDVLRQATWYLQWSNDSTRLDSIAATLIRLLGDAIDTGVALEMLDILCVLHLLRHVPCFPPIGERMQAMLKRISPDRLRWCFRVLAETPEHALDRLGKNWKEALLLLIDPLSTVQRDPELIKGVHELGLQLQLLDIQRAIHPALASVDIESLLQNYPMPLNEAHWSRLPALVRKACQTIGTPEEAFRLIKQVVYFLTPQGRQPHGTVEATHRNAMLRELTLGFAALLKAAPRPLTQGWRDLASWTWMVDATISLIAQTATGPRPGRLIVQGPVLPRYAPCWRHFAQKSALFEGTLSLLCHPKPGDMPGNLSEPGQQPTLELFLMGSPAIQSAVLSLPDEVWARLSHPDRGLEWNSQSDWSNADRADVALAMADAGLITPGAQADFLSAFIDHPGLVPLIERWRQDPASSNVPWQVLDKLPASALDTGDSRAQRDNLTLILLWLCQTLSTSHPAFGIKAVTRCIDWLQGTVHFDPEQLRRIGASLSLGPTRQDVIEQVGYMGAALKHQPGTLVQLLIGNVRQLLKASGDVPTASRKAHLKRLRAVAEQCRALLKSLPKDERRRLKKELTALLRPA